MESNATGFPEVPTKHDVGIQQSYRNPIGVSICGVVGVEVKIHGASVYPIWRIAILHNATATLEFHRNPLLPWEEHAWATPPDKLRAITGQSLVGYAVFVLLQVAAYTPDAPVVKSCIQQSSTHVQSCHTAHQQQVTQLLWGTPWQSRVPDRRSVRRHRAAGGGCTPPLCCP